MEVALQQDAAAPFLPRPISNYSDSEDAVECSGENPAVVAALSFALATAGVSDCLPIAGASAAVNQAAALVFVDFKELTPLPAVMARVDLLRSFCESNGKP